MALGPFPGGGGQGWEQFAGRIAALFKQKLTRPFWLWGSPTADLPTEAAQGANEGAIAYDDTLNAPTFYNGSAWKTVGVVGGGAALTRVDDTNVTLTLGGTPASSLLAAVSITAGWSGTLAVGRGGTGVSSLGNITKVDDTNVTLTLGGTPTGAVINSTSFTLGWTGQLSAARGGTGNSGGAWTSYTPTVTAGSGAFTSVAASGWYQQIGKIVFVRITISITTNGTAATFTQVTLPVASANRGSSDQQFIGGKETAVVGTMVAGNIQNNSSNLIFLRYDNTYLGGDGYVIILSGTYEAA